MNMKITLIDNQKHEFEIEVDGALISDATMIEYHKAFYVYGGSQSDKAYRPKFVECRPPVFIE